MQPYYSQELYHHGVKNQRWGFRRWQNKDGSLTPAGRLRYSKMANRSLSKQQSLQRTRLDNWNKSGHDPKYSDMGKKEEKLYNKYKDSIDKLEKDKEIRESNQNKKEPVVVNPPKEDTVSTNNQKNNTQNTTKEEKTKPDTNVVRTKSVKDMSDEELNAIVNRMNLEQRYAQLNPAQVSRGKKITDAIVAKASQEMLNRASKVAGDVIERKLREMAGIQNQQKK